MQKIFLYYLICSTLCLPFCATHAYAIGISPGRWTNDLYEYDCSFDADNTYTLIRPSSRRYSQFTVFDVAGMTGSLAGCSASSGIEYIDDKSILIDWESEELASLGDITASIHVQSSHSWDCPVEPGGDVYVDSLVNHMEIPESSDGIGGFLSCVSQLALWRNYAPRVYLQDMATENLTAQLVWQLEDKQASWFSQSAEAVWFGYEIDWDGDGVTDQSGTTTFDEEPVPHWKYPTCSTWTSGTQISTLALDHVYAAGGDYMANITVRDFYNNHSETTSMQIPISVVPEPATFALLGLGGLLLRKRQSSTYTITPETNTPFC